MWPLFSWCILVLFFFFFFLLSHNICVYLFLKMLTFFRWLQIQCLWHFLQFCLWCWVMELKRLVIFLVKWHRTRSWWYNANCMSELLQIRTWPILKQGLRSELLRLHKPVESISQFIDLFFFFFFKSKELDTTWCVLKAGHVIDIIFTWLLTEL